MESEQQAAEHDQDDSQPHDPRVVVTKGSPWLIDRGRRERWSAAEFVTKNAVDVRQVGDPVLHAPAKKHRMDKKELEVLVQRLFASMVGAHGIGIAAPQIGVSLRVVIIDVDEVGVVAVNPEIEFTSAEADEMSEGCLSVRGLYGMLERPLIARLNAVDIAGRKFSIEGQGLGAQCMLHETDHTEGILYVDRLRTRKDLFPVEADDDGPISGRSREEMEQAPSR